MFPETEIGLMTAEEYLHLRNPGGKSHPSDSYDTDVFKMNADHARQVVVLGYGRDRVVIEKMSRGYRLTDDDGKIVAIVHKGVAYYDNPRWKNHIPKSVSDRGQTVDLGFTSLKQVKYLSEVAPLISPIAENNVLSYPVVLQHTIVDGEPMTVRAEKSPKTNAGTTLAIFNSQGLVVAMASNEWGATLLRVAQEYRGKGLGKLIGQYWYEFNPSFESGGFTSAGRANALALWQARVREFVARGWYSALVRQGRLTQQKVRQILAGVSRSKAPGRQIAAPAPLKPTGDVLVYSDGVTFVVYDRAFLTEQDERFIHGFGFFREEERIGPYIYRIEYDRPFADLVTKVALQIARDNGEDLYDGEGYHDMLETEGIPGVVRQGDTLRVTRDLVPVKAAAQKEKRLRKAVDPYGEKHALLLEMAESKWS
jgi:hypothetical protein